MQESARRPDHSPISQWPPEGRPGSFALAYSGSVGSDKRWQLIHFSDKALTVTKKPQKKATGTRGRPTKKTDSLIATLLRLISDGGPYDLCCQAVGITRETFYDWRRDDPAFAARVEQAAAKGSLGRLKKIEQHGQNDWHAFGWMLERRHPEFFARAETQLTVSQSVSTSPSNIVVIGPERAKILATRHEQLRAKSIALLDAQQANTGNGQGSAQQPSAASELLSAQDPAAPSDSAPAQEPLPTKPASWWRQFVFPVLGGLIQKADAVQALKLVLAELRIEVDDRLVDFAADSVAQSVFSQMLEKLTGSDLGWRQLCQIYERQQARERLWADH
jgi:hypothetical protein